MMENIHQGQPLKYVGAEPDQAQLNVILIHGRGATAEGMIPLAQALHSQGIRFIMPQAARDYWYPQSAFAPIESNEPDLTSALRLIDDVVADLMEAGSRPQQIALGGFSQGACLAAEYVARNARAYGGLFLFSGALIGPEGAPRDYPGTLAGTPVFIGGSDVDPWVNHDLLQKTALVFESLEAKVDFQTYPGMGHTVNQDEIDRVHALLNAALEAGQQPL